MTFPPHPESAYPSAMFEGVGGDQPVTTLTLYTDAFIVRGTILTRQRRVSDILNLAEDRFIVLSDVTTDEFGTRGETTRAGRSGEPPDRCNGPASPSPRRSPSAR